MPRESQKVVYFARGDAGARGTLEAPIKAPAIRSMSRRLSHLQMAKTTLEKMQMKMVAAPMFSPRVPLRLTLTMTVTLTSLRKRQRKSTSIQMLNLALTKRLTTTCSLIAAAHGAVF